MVGLDFVLFIGDILHKFWVINKVIAFGIVFKNYIHILNSLLQVLLSQ